MLLARLPLVTPLWSRIAEKIIVRRYIRPAISTNALLDQFAFKPTGSTTCALIFCFRKKHSTSLALNELLHSLYSYIDKQDIVLGMFFDLQKAFDTIDHEIILYKLYNYGVSWDCL